MNKAIKKIELDLGGKVVSLTPQQAQNLKDALDDLFGKRVIREIVKEKEYIPQPYPLPYRGPYWDWYDRVTCEITGTGAYVDTCMLTSSCSDSGTLRLTG